jgi:GNAT superfamily N-acetyltransferase
MVERADILSSEAQGLILRLNQELAAMYPEEGANHFRLDPAEVAPGRGGFFMARADEVLGCGAVRLLDDGRAEVKRMFVVPTARGRGVGRAILTALVDEARALGAASVVLETGIRQLEAIALYERAGFSRIAPWGEYIASAATSICMMKPL